MLVIAEAGADQVGIVRELFVEYARSLGFSLCFQGFDREIAGLPGEYAPPAGRIFLAQVVPDAGPREGRSTGAAGGGHPAAGRAGPGDREDLDVKERMAGCVALRRLGADTCEMKRLYVRPAFRGRGAGRALARAAIAAAGEAGYRQMRLDTIPATMAAAVALYRELGFRDIPPYGENPIPGALCMELEL